MIGSTVIWQAAKKGKQKWGWKGFFAVGALAFVLKRVLQKQLKQRTGDEQVAA